MPSRSLGVLHWDAPPEHMHSILRPSSQTGQHAGEIGGTLLGTCGALVLTLGGRSDRGVTLIGDMVCVLSTFCFLGYFTIGRHLRSWVPLFTYMFLITCEFPFACMFMPLLWQGQAWRCC